MCSHPAGLAPDLETLQNDCNMACHMRFPTRFGASEAISKGFVALSSLKLGLGRPALYSCEGAIGARVAIESMP